MKHLVFYFLASIVPIFSDAHSILDLLKIEVSDQSKDFVENKKQFQLHQLVTEQRHPKTWNLSHQIQTNTLDGVRALLGVDEDISDKFLQLSKDTALLEQAASAVEKAIRENRKIYVYGCGATGRLAKQMESSFWRPFWRKLQSRPEWERLAELFPDIENRLIGEMTGGDLALVSSLEGLEDLQLIGRLQLADHQIQKGDVVFAVTEGGETSSVIGTILGALSHYGEPAPDLIQEAQKHLYFVYNNPDSALVPFERSRNVIDNEAITKIPLFTGPQSISGSTRLQATTSETFVVGIILEQAIYQLLKPHLSNEELMALGFCERTMDERLLSFLPLQKTVYDAQIPLSHLTDLEASTYSSKRFSTYFAQNALITVFIDSTERSPTFGLFPLDAFASPRRSWIQVWTPAQDKLDAWKNFLGRPFHGLQQELYQNPFSQLIEDPYLRTAALNSLKHAGNDQQFLYDFSFSAANLETRGPQEKDLGVMVLFADEMGQLLDTTSPFQSWLKVFGESNADIAVLLVPSIPLDDNDPVIQTVRDLAPKALILQFPLNNDQDPLWVRQHVGLKMFLNAHSTAVMAKLGRVVGNTMTNVHPTNLKLVGRATFLILSHINENLPETDRISYSDANAVLFDIVKYAERCQKAGQNSEVALSIIRVLEASRKQAFVSWEEAEALLQQYGLEKYLCGYTFLTAGGFQVPLRIASSGQ